MAPLRAPENGAVYKPCVGASACLRPIRSCSATKNCSELLIQKAGVHDGRWILMTNFGIAPGTTALRPSRLRLDAR